jgi:glycine/D-amino acid oxidase-like deaminating enzyme
MAKYDVIVVGSGVTGLSAAYHLRRLGIENLVVLGADSGESEKTPGIAVGGFWDNFTRLSHVHGTKKAAEFWRFGDLAFHALDSFRKEKHLSRENGKRLRFCVSEAEDYECRQAASELKSEGLAVHLHLDHHLKSQAISMVQEEDFAAHVDPLHLIKALKVSEAVREFPVTGLEHVKDAVVLKGDYGHSLAAEFVVLACHLGVSAIHPFFAEVLVPVDEQWSLLETTSPLPLPVGSVFSANHTYEWGVITGEKCLHFGGGRYLKPMAGIGAATSEVSERVAAHHRQQLKRLLGVDSATTKSQSFLDLRPCDELPVIGPMFGESRLLIAAGFMGCGLAQGFFAGQLVAELIKTGRAAQLPEAFLPKRLRTGV